MMWKKSRSLTFREVTGETLNHGSNKTLMLVWIFIIEDLGKTEICILRRSGAQTLTET